MEEQVHQVTDVIQRAAKGLFWAESCKLVCARLAETPAVTCATHKNGTAP